MKMRLKGYAKPRLLDEGYNARFEGATFENGDKCTGQIVLEDGRNYFVAIDGEGNEYETSEMPCIRIDLTGPNVHFVTVVMT